MKNVRLVEISVTSVLSVFLLIFIFSCSQKKEQYLSLNKTSNELIPPRVTVLANLPDSNKPVTIIINKAQKPKIVFSKNQPTIHSFIDPITHAPTAPEAQGIGFFTNFTTDDGLPLDGVFCSVIDKKGNLWLGTNGGGVSRYDGKSFTNYTIEHGLTNNSVGSIKEDKNGNLWFGTWGGGVSCYDGKSFTNYTTAQGLSNNYVLCIIEDRTGNLWFGTGGGGINRYDGKSFINYTTVHGLVNNIVWSIREDNRGNLWLGTIDGLSCFDGKSFINYTTAQGLVNNFINCITEDRTGNLWLGTNGGGVSRYDGKSFSNYTIEHGLANDSVICITEDKTGNLWFGTQEGGVSRYDGKRFTNYTTAQGLANNSVRCITEDKTGNLWFGTGGGGINRYDGKSFINYTTAQGLGKNLVFGTTEDKKGNLWFGTAGGGVSCYDGKSFTNYTTTQGLANNALTCITEDKKGNLWFCTLGGVSCYNGKSFTNYSTAQGLANNFINCIAEDKSGNLWFGTQEGGVSCYDGKSFINYTTAQGLANNFIYCITEDKTGNFWFGTTEGVSRYDGKRFTNYTTAQGLSSNSVTYIAEDKKGSLWLGTGGGVSRYDGKSFINYSTENGLPDNNVTNIIIDSASNIIFGTNSGIGILVSFAHHSPGEKKVNSISAQNSLSNEELKNYVPQFEIYNSSTGYPIKDLNTQAMIKDSKGIIWMGTGAAKIGLVRFDYSAIHKSNDPPVVVLRNIKVNNEHVCWYDLLPVSVRKEFRYDSNTTASTIIEEVTTLGKVLSDADKDSMRSKFRGVKFDSIRSFYPIPENLVLPYQHNNVTFDFAAIELARPNVVRYQYMLEGYDEDWNPVTDKTNASFGNIHEGKYTFKLKARSPDGVWSKPLIYTFEVQPPWWRTWWAYTLYTLVFLIVLWSFIKWRIRTLKKERSLLEEKVALRTHELQVEKEKVETTLAELEAMQVQLIEAEKVASVGKLQQAVTNERLRISRELHDEVGATLSSISIFSQAAIQKNESGNTADSKNILERIGETSREVMGELSDVIWLINPRNDNLQKIIQRISNYALPLCRTRNICFEIKVAASVENLDLSVDKRKAIYLIIKEAVNNSIKYAAAKRLAIQFEKNHEVLHIAIEDDGNGFDQNNSFAGNGLNNIKQRANDVNGKIKFGPVQQNGTEIILQVPLTSIGD
jgi:signal transduction histidine kinase/streptogramin lyase